MGRVEPSRAVVAEMEKAGVLVFAGGLVEDMSEAFSADGTSGEMVVTDGPYTETTEYLGGCRGPEGEQGQDEGESRGSCQDRRDRATGRFEVHELSIRAREEATETRANPS